MDNYLHGVRLKQEKIPHVFLSLIPCSGVDGDHLVVCGYGERNIVDLRVGCEWITTCTESRLG